jgi:branched-chain amino acid transport system ATP-binding protein
MTMPRTLSDPLLDVRNLHARYGQARILHGIDLTIGRGEVVVLLGANGAGKTTTLRALSGLVERTGTIRFRGDDIVAKAPADIVARRLIQVPEGRGTFADLTVEENLLLGAYSVKSDRLTQQRNRDRLLAMFPILGERSQQRAGLLSGGEQQMLAIARALMGEPELLVLDEPSLGLAPAITRSVFETLKSLHEESGLSLLIVEQNAELSLAIANHAYVLEAGVIQVDGPAESIRDDAGLRRAYLGY